MNLCEQVCIDSLSKNMHLLELLKKHTDPAHAGLRIVGHALLEVRNDENLKAFSGEDSRFYFGPVITFSKAEFATCQEGGLLQLRNFRREFEL